MSRTRRTLSTRTKLVSLYLFGSLAAAMLGLATGARASWSDYGHNNGNSGARPDNHNHTTCWNDAGSNPAEMGAAWSHYDSATALVMLWFQNDCSVTRNVLFDDNLVDPGFGGLHTCNLYNGEGHCLSGTVQLNPTAVTTSADRQSVWCHEIGHSAGLGHGGPDTCMESWTSFPNPLIINAHEVNHIANLL